MKEEKEKLTEEQLWLLCEQEEKKKRFVRELSNKEKVIDWDYENYIFEKSRGLK